MPMLQLRQKTGLSVQLAVKSGLDAIYIEQFESMKAVRVYPQVGRKVPLYAAACPRVLLSGLSEKIFGLIFVIKSFPPLLNKL